jgi:hypothetical protein
MLKLSYPKCEIGRRLRSPCHDVWECLTDTTRWPKWGPSVTAVEAEKRFIQQGSRGRVRIPLGLWIPFVITGYRDKRYWSWSIWGVRATGHRTEPLGDGSCLLIFEVPFFAMPYLFVCWLAIRRIANLLERTT